MKRINSSSWKKPSERDIRNSQDSAISSQGMPNSQYLEFSQVSTQDLFGQNSGFQNEQGNQKMSMYEKWLSKRSFTKHNSSDDVAGSITPQNNQPIIRTDRQYCNPNVGPGRSALKITPTQGYSLNRLKAGEKDERDILEQILNSFYENKHEVKTLVVNLKEMLEGMGGSYSAEAKEVLSSFMEEISKSHDSLVSLIQDNGKDMSDGKECEKQLASKDCKITSLETKVTLLEQQVDKAKADETSYIVKALQEITDKVGSQNQAVTDYMHNIEELKEDFKSFNKKMQKDVHDSETRVLKELKKVPKDVKNAINIKSDVLSCIQGVPAEMEQSLKFCVEGLTKDIKSELSKEQKKFNEQHLRKQFDRLFHKMDALVGEHKKIHQFVEANFNESVNNHLEEISDNVKQLKDKSISSSYQVKQIEQSLTHCQEEHSQHLQNMLDQQKKFWEKCNFHSESLIKTRQGGNVSACEGQYKHKAVNHDQNPSFSNEGMKRNYVKTQSSELIERNYTIQEINYQSSSRCSTPQERIMQQVENKQNTIPLPITEQRDIHSSHTQYRFKSPMYNLLSTNDFIQTNTEANGSGKRMPFISPFKRLGSFVNHSKHGPSPVATVKPHRHNDNNHFQLNRINEKGNELMYENYQKSPDRNIYGKKTFNMAKNKQNEEKYTNKDNTQENHYWLRKRIPPIYNLNNLFVLRTPHRSKNNQEHSSSSQIKSRETKKRQRCENQEKNEKVNQKKKYDDSIYDFKEDSCCRTPGHSIRSKLPLRRMGLEESSHTSSPALTLKFDWAQTRHL